MGRAGRQHPDHDPALRPGAGPGLGPAASTADLPHRLGQHNGDLLILAGTVIRLQFDRLPSGKIPKPVWLRHSRAGLDQTEVDLAWQAFLRRFDIEHTFRMLKHTLGWTTPILRSPKAADRWTRPMLANGCR